MYATLDRGGLHMVVHHSCGQWDLMIAFPGKEVATDVWNLVVKLTLDLLPSLTALFADVTLKRD